ncbi:hypothetical protein HPB48_001939 [Haemaphysalis longicornis]|uniref:Uncharacterized protein n=1 Tax=Haemaphysalis longicornis TaxID=44386 RepID=A0A9J6FV90_HAELO|nr:hypothetical protein HPB48_001939 [Haemaphysalis longicornis]
MGKPRVKRAKADASTESGEDEETLVECAGCGEWWELSRTPFKTKEEAKATPRYDCKQCTRLTFIQETMTQRLKRISEEWELRVQGLEAQMSGANEAHDLTVAKLESQWQQEKKKREELEDQVGMLKGLVVSMQHSGVPTSTAEMQEVQRRTERKEGETVCGAPWVRETGAPTGKTAQTALGNAKESSTESPILKEDNKPQDSTELGMKERTREESRSDDPESQSLLMNNNDEEKGRTTPVRPQGNREPAEVTDSPMDSEGWQSGRRKRKRQIRAQTPTQVQPRKQLETQKQPQAQMSQCQNTPAHPIKQHHVGGSNLEVRRRALVVGDTNAHKLKHRALRWAKGDRRLWFYTKERATLQEAAEKVDEELRKHTNCQHLVVLHAGQFDLVDDWDPQVEVQWLREKVGQWVQQFPQNHYLIYAIPVMEGNAEETKDKRHRWNELAQDLSRVLGPQVEFVRTAGHITERDMSDDGYSWETAQGLGTRLGKRVCAFLGVAMRQHSAQRSPQHVGNGNPQTQQTLMAAMGNMLLQLSRRV